MYTNYKLSSIFVLNLIIIKLLLNKFIKSDILLSLVKQYLALGMVFVLIIC